MVVKLDCKKANVIVSTRVNSRTSGITRYRSPEEKQEMFLEKMLAVLHEVTLK